jgi:hypothetical protein
MAQLAHLSCTRLVGFLLTNEPTLLQSVALLLGGRDRLWRIRSGWHCHAILTPALKRPSRYAPSDTITPSPRRVCMFFASLALLCAESRKLNLHRRICAIAVGCCCIHFSNCSIGHRCSHGASMGAPLRDLPGRLFFLCHLFLKCCDLEALQPHSLLRDLQSRLHRRCSGILCIRLGLPEATCHRARSWTRSWRDDASILLEAHAIHLIPEGAGCLPREVEVTLPLHFPPQS